MTPREVPADALRRRLVASALLSAGLAASGLAARSQVAAPYPSTASGTPSPDDLPAKEADIVIVGAGAAGLAAAISAAEVLSAEGGTKKRPRIVVLEKNARAGGDTLISGGYFNAVDPERQGPQGIEDSPELFLRQIREARGDAGHDADAADSAADASEEEEGAALARTLAFESTDALRWLESLGMTFLPTVAQVYGSVHPRAHKPILPRGTGYVRCLTEAALRHGVEIRTKTAVLGLLGLPAQSADAADAARPAGPASPASPANPAESVSGVIIRDAKGTLRVIRARAGVILAAGGFGASRAMLRQVAPETADLPIDTQPGSTGDMHRAALEIGAQLIDLGFVECVPGSRKGIDYPIRLDYIPHRVVFVNARGRRFTDETGSRGEIASAILREGDCWSIADDETVRRFDMLNRKNLHRGLHAGEAFRAPDARTLAQLTGLPEEALTRTLTTPPASGRLHPSPSVPLWACRTHLRVHATLGGIRIDADARVLRADGMPIAGLWAAGACTGGIHGRNRIGGNGINTAVVFGRIAGRAAAEKL